MIEVDLYFRVVFRYVLVSTFIFLVFKVGCSGAFLGRIEILVLVFVFILENGG